MQTNKEVTRRRFIAASALFLGASFTSSRAFATDVKKEAENLGVDTSNIKGEASSKTKEELSAVEAEYNKAQDVLYQYTFRAEQLAEALAKTQEDLQKTAEAIALVREDIAETTKELEAAQEVLSGRISANYKSNNLSMINVLLGADSFEDFANRVYYMGKISEQDAEIIQNVKDIKAVLDEQNRQLEARLADQKALEEKQAADTAEAQAIVEEQAKYVDGLSDNVKELYEKKRQEEIADRDRKIKAAVEEARRIAAEKAAREAAAKAQGVKLRTTPGTPSPNVVANAMQYIGSPYVWGASGPGSFDCSGLTSHAYKLAGITIPRTSSAQYGMVKSKGNLVTDPSLLVPGDLVFYYKPVSHVGIYIGNGQIVHAPTFGQTVKTAPLNVWGAFVGGGSIL
ncbi:MAG: NlpC/P60 family protein [Coriobacteriia bacterium]|nr:NlpC/P60 family protein [Coriobacteriia bacterium]